jgi:hypothetical protein
MGTEKPPDAPDVDGRPPFGSWRQWYLAVLLSLVFLVALFYVFTRMFE